MTSSAPHLALDGGGGALVVAGQHHRADAHGLELGEGGGARGLHRVGHGDHAQKLAVLSEEERRLALVGLPSRLLGERACRDVVGLHHAQVAGA